MGKKKKEKDVIYEDDILEPKNIENDEEEEIVIQKKKKKESKVDKGNPIKAFNMYKFIVKIIAFAILVTFAIVMIVNKENAVGAIYLISGIVCAFAAIIRVIPLLRTLKSKRAKLVSLIEILVHLVVGAYLIMAAFLHWNIMSENNLKDLDELTGITKFNLDAYRFIIVFVLFTRGMCYYYITIMCEERTDRMKFWLHAIIMLLSILLAAIPLTPEKIVWVLVFLAIGSALVIGGEAGTGYYRYRKAVSASKKKEQEKNKSDEKPLEAPANDETKIIDEIDPSIIPVNDNNNQDSNIIS